MVFGKQSFQGYESNRRDADGVRVENILRNQSLMTALQCEPEHLKGRIISMSMVNDTVWDAKGNKEQCESNSQAVAEHARKFPSRSLVFLAVVGLSWGLDQKKNGTEPFLTNQMDPGIDWQNKRWQISFDPVIRYFVPPVLLQEENYEAKEGERSQYTSMVAQKRWSCFSAQ